MLDRIERALVLAPHPDDEVLGCGGTIARLTALGRHVEVAVVTRGTARLAIAGQEVTLGPGRAVFLPAAETASGPLVVQTEGAASATVHAVGLPRR